MLELATLATGIKTVKELYSAFSALKEVRQNQALLDKLEEILDLRATLLDAKEEILTLREQVQELEQAKKVTQELKFDDRHGIYRGVDDAGDQLAYCPKCWGEHGRKAPLKTSNDGHRCSICRIFYKDPDYKPSPSATLVGVARPRRW